jgi:hypothetical protein
MVDVSAIAGTVSALKGAIDITQAMIGLRDAQAIQTKVIELNSKILEAQSSAFLANEERSALIERVGRLEQEIAALKAWNAEKNRYELTQWGNGAFAYVLKETEQAGEPRHALCANCYQRGAKSILQSNGEPRWMLHAWECPSCRAAVKASVAALNPPPPASEGGP